MNLQRLPFIYIALLEGVAVATVGSAISDSPMTTLRFTGLILTGVACLALQMVIWSRNKSAFVSPTNTGFFKRQPALAMLLSSVIGLVVGVAVFAYIK